MEEISDAVGFANRQSFYSAFYKLNNCTPREYRIEHLGTQPQEPVAPKKRGRKPKSKKK